MSHIVTIETKVHDPQAVVAACARLKLAAPVQGKATLFSGECSGLLIHLPGWQYPAVIDTVSGKIQFDNFEGQWGDESQLHKFLQSYAVEKTKLEARKKGYTVTEQAQTDGSIKLHVIQGAST